MRRAEILCGDVLEVLPTLPAESFDACLCDPPYGIGFMGKAWDHGVPSAEVWAEALRVLKPGAFLMAFGGTRTYHRLTCNIEDAGFEIRDSLCWLYGSGFPKSHDISKAIDKAAGAEREAGIRGPYSSRRPRAETAAVNAYGDGLGDAASALVTAPATPEAATWSGYGTALKPAHEIVIHAQKPYILSQLCAILALKIRESLCLLRSSARAAELNSELSRLAFGEDGPDSALWGAVAGCSTPGDLCALMATLPSGSAIPTSLSIALSWLGILGAALQAESTFTTETATSLTTDLRILNSSPSAITPASIIEAATGGLGTESSAYLAVATFSAVASRLLLTREHSAREPAISMGSGPGLLPELRPIILAMKPCAGTFAANALEWGVAGLNVDGGRVAPTGERLGGGAETWTRHKGGWHRPWMDDADHQEQKAAEQKAAVDRATTAGRWPANLLFSHTPFCREVGTREVRSDGHHPSGRPVGSRVAGPSGHGGQSGLSERKAGKETVAAWDCHPLCAVRMLDEQVGETASGANPTRRGSDKFRQTYGDFAGQRDCVAARGADKGTPSRFYYCAKASTAERNLGGVDNRHPTVKPVDLCRYLATLLLPPARDGEPRRLLVPYSGSGSELIGAARAGWEEGVGIDKDGAHCAVARRRIEGDAPLLNTVEATP